MIRVGIVDSGIDGAAREHVTDRADFPSRDGAPCPAEPRDLHGHGSAVAAILAPGGAPRIELLDARVFFGALRTSAQQIADALDWLADRNARLVNLSIGLRADRGVLRAACERAILRGVLLLSSAPARGAPVYPAAYPGVVRATGDARCAPGEISFLDTAQADFGGHARSACGTVAGASAGCAHVTAALAWWLAAHPDAGNEQALAALRDRTSHRGPERRGGGS